MSLNSTPLADLTSIARDMRREVLEMSRRSKTGHLGPSLGIVDILAVLYFRILDVDPARMTDEQRDRFILSKGHAAAALYAALAARGFLSPADLEGYCVDHGTLHGHPCMHTPSGIEYSSGSLGHGLSVGAGIALGLRKQHIASRVMVLLGDGECNEGSVWEAAMFAATHNLSKLTAIVDCNGFQGFGATTEVHKGDLARMWAGFGWHVLVCDGHDLEAFTDACRTAGASNGPTVILAQTVSGKGVRSIESTLAAHYVVLDDAAHAQALKDIYAE